MLLLVSLLITGACGMEECPLPTPCPEGNITPSGPANVSEVICVYLFYGQGCPHCARVEPVVDGLAAKYPRVQVKKFEVYFNTTNQAMFRDFLTRYNVSVEGVPILFIGDRALIGESSIRDNLEPSILYFIEHGPICPEEYGKMGDGGNGLSPSTKPDLTLPSVVVAALVDSVNPCAFAVLIILLSYLTSLNDRRRVKYVGIAYIVTVFIVYFISGIGLLVFVQGLGLTKIVYAIAAGIAITAGAVNLYEAIKPGSRYSLSIPESKKGLIKEYILRASIPAAIVLGGLVSIFELPCTGGIYLAILGLLGTRMTFTEGIPYLVLYNLIFVLPLFIIFAVVYWGLSPSMVEGWRTGSKPIVRALMGLVMIGLGAAMLLGVV
ncbi:MAG: hypothetical protein QHG99_02470 [Methanomicrobiales archaeon]|nr:hypothetical protein [Methanomicrobiales archaeon]